MNDPYSNSQQAIALLKGAIYSILKNHPNGLKLTSYEKKYLEKNNKKKKMIQEYLKEQINNKIITKQTTVEELLN